MGMHETIVTPKTKQIWHLGTPLGDYCPAFFSFRERNYCLPSQVPCFNTDGYASGTALGSKNLSISSIAFLKASLYHSLTEVNLI